MLYPTFFHEKASELAPRFQDDLALAHARRPAEGTIRISHVANVAGVWVVTDLDRLRAIEGEHGLVWSAVESRFHYRDRPVVQVVAVRLSSLAKPVVVPELRRYQGCVSWVTLDTPVDVGGASPVVGDPAFRERMDALERALGPLVNANAE